LPRLLLGERLDERFALSLWAVPVLLVVLHPAVLGRLTAWAARVMRVEAPAARIPWPSLVAAVGWILAAWLLYGVSLAMLVAPFEPLTLPGIGLLTSAFALAWSVGFLGAALVVIAAPAGLGFREIALYATLAGVVSPGPAALVVVASRVVMTLGDLAWALLSGARRSVSRRAPA
jgi:glycosyltransferase 2 family protein